MFFGCYLTGKNSSVIFILRGKVFVGENVRHPGKISSHFSPVKYVSCYDYSNCYGIVCDDVFLFVLFGNIVSGSASLPALEVVRSGQVRSGLV